MNIETNEQETNELAPAPPILHQQIQPAKLRTDGGTQQRVQLNMLTIEDYAEAMRGGAHFPAVDAFFDGAHYWLADGFHRQAAALKANTLLDVNVHRGTQRQAILFSLGANASHGLPRSDADKRRVVLRLLDDEEWSRWSNTMIAEKTRVSAPFVGNIRRAVQALQSLGTLASEQWSLSDAEIAQLSGISETVVASCREFPGALTRNVSSGARVTKDGRVMDTSRIGGGHQPAESETPDLFADSAGETFDDDTRRTAQMEIADPEGSLELEATAIEEAEARDSFDPVADHHQNEMIREEKAARYCELLDALRDLPDGMRTEDLLALGITHEEIEDAKRWRLVERHVNGRVFYVWQIKDVVRAIRDHGSLTLMQLEDMGCQRYAVDSARIDRYIELSSDGASFVLARVIEHPADGSAQIPAGAHHTRPEDASPARTPSSPVKAQEPKPDRWAQTERRLKGRALVLTHTLMPKGLGVQITVNLAGAAPGDALNSQMFPAEQVMRLGEGEYELIAQRIAADKDKVKAAPVKKPAAKKTPARGAAKKATKKSAAKAGRK